MWDINLVRGVVFDALHFFLFFTKALRDAINLQWSPAEEGWKTPLIKYVLLKHAQFHYHVWKTAKRMCYKLYAKTGMSTRSCLVPLALRETGANLETQACHDILVKWKSSLEWGHNVSELDLLRVTKIARNKHKFIYCVIL